MTGEKKGGNENDVNQTPQDFKRAVRKCKWSAILIKTQCGITPCAFESPMTQILSIHPEDTGVSWKTICSLISHQNACPDRHYVWCCPTRGWMDGFFNTFLRGQAHPQAPLLTWNHPRNYLHHNGVTNPSVPRPMLHIRSHILITYEICSGRWDRIK